MVRVCGIELVYATINGGTKWQSVDRVYKYEFIAKQRQNICIKRGLQMGFIWEIGLREYKSHVDKGLEFFISSYLS